jgi:hypothetical protein
VGARTTFDASQSSGATGRIQSWLWNFGDGATAEGSTVEHVYREPGAYVVRLSIETDATASECNVTAVQHYVVANAPPIADVGADRLVGVNQEVLFDGSGARDPDGAITSWLGTSATVPPRPACTSAIASAPAANSRSPSP